MMYQPNLLQAFNLKMDLFSLIRISIRKVLRSKLSQMPKLSPKCSLNLSCAEYPLTRRESQWMKMYNEVGTGQSDWLTVCLSHLWHHLLIPSSSLSILILPSDKKPKSVVNNSKGAWIHIITWYGWVRVWERYHDIGEIKHHQHTRAFGNNIWLEKSNQ